ncbi:MAG TPA: hypothetical protein VFC19_08235 [Candidatus Limnocylindrales bacterium]|nr:hypothetical protein [Candidatus Limnocylindrales bacterium]
MTTFAPESRVAVGHLIVRREDEDEYVVGDPGTGTFVAVPQVGARLIELLAAGRSIEEATEQIEEETGEYIDGIDFVEVLVEAGVLDNRTGPEPPPDRKVKYWAVSKIPARFVKPLFGRAAWTFYVFCLAASFAVFIFEPALIPSYEDTFFLPDILVDVLITNAVVVFFAYVHEIWHGLAGAAAGIPSRLRLERRGIFPVLETDLSGLWALAPERRYSPFLAGMAIDSVLLFASLAPRFAWSRGWIDPPPGLIRFLALMVFTQLARIIFQTLAYLRTDMYLVMTTATGCRNLHQVTRLSLKRLIRKLPPDEAIILRDADTKDLKVARWYRWLYLAGLAWMVWFAFYYLLPSTRLVLGWLFSALSDAPVFSYGWWEAVALAFFTLLSLLLPLAVWLRNRHREAREARGATA